MGDEAGLAEATASEFSARRMGAEDSASLDNVKVARERHMGAKIQPVWLGLAEAADARWR